MSVLKYFYKNNFDTATLAPSSEVTQMPAENVQVDILSTVWKTKDSFTIIENYNDTFGFKADGGATSVIVISAGTYTGLALASQIQTQMRTATSLNLEVTHNDTATNAFVFSTGATATALALYFTDYASSTIAVDLGFSASANQTGSVAYSGSVSLQSQSWMQATIASGTNTHLVLDGYNMPAGTSVLVRLADQTSTFSGLRDGGSMSASVSVSLSATRSIYALPSTFTGKGVQLSWHDGSVANTTVGRVWMGSAFTPANQIDDVISWSKHKVDKRSKKTYAYGGATYFDKKDSLDQYSVVVPPLDPYYSAADKTGFETFLDNVGDTKCFYTTFESDLTKAVYGYVVGDDSYDRLKNTTTVLIKKLVIQEQK